MLNLNVKIDVFFILKDSINVIKSDIVKFVVFKYMFFI